MKSKVRNILNRKFNEEFQKALKTISLKAIQNHFSKGLSVHEQIGDAIYEVFPNGERKQIQQVQVFTGKQVIDKSDG